MSKYREAIVKIVTERLGPSWYIAATDIAESVFDLHSAALRRKDEALRAAKAYLEWEMENAREFPDANIPNPLLIDQITAALEETNG